MRKFIFVSLFIAACGDDITQVIIQPNNQPSQDAGLADSGPAPESMPDSGLAVQDAGPDVVTGPICNVGEVRCNGGTSEECYDDGTVHWVSAATISTQFATTCDPKCTAPIGTFHVRHGIAAYSAGRGGFLTNVTEIKIDSVMHWVTRQVEFTSDHANAEMFCQLRYGSEWKEFKNTSLFRFEQGRATQTCDQMLDQTALLGFSYYPNINSFWEQNNGSEYTFLYNHLDKGEVPILQYTNQLNVNRFIFCERLAVE